MHWRQVPRGPRPPDAVHAIIETPRGSRYKYAASHDHPGFELSKLIPESLAFPCNAGFFARCWGEDGDPLDANVLGAHPIPTGVVCTVRPIAVMRMKDGGQRDDKVVCVLVGDPAAHGLTGLKSVPVHVRQALDDFYRAYRKQEGTEDQVKLQGWAGRGEAKRLLREGYARFDKEFGRD